MRSTVILCAILLIAGAASATTRYIAPNGTDTGTCTNAASPCLSLEYAGSKITIGAITTGSIITRFKDWRRRGKGMRAKALRLVIICLMLGGCLVGPQLEFGKQGRVSTQPATITDPPKRMWELFMLDKGGKGVVQIWQTPLYFGRAKNTWKLPIMIDSIGAGTVQVWTAPMVVDSVRGSTEDGDTLTVFYRRTDRPQPIRREVVP